MAQQLSTYSATSAHTPVIVSKQYIEQQARAALRKGTPLEQALPYPADSAAGMHFAATYLIGAQAHAKAASSARTQPQPAALAA